ncbi:MAG TPA: HAD-IA family hydrolase, partial [Myxococcota bacterium]
IALREPAAATYARSAGRFGIEVAAGRLDEALARSLRRAPPMVFPEVSASAVAERERAWWRDIVRAAFRSAGAGALPAQLDACFESLYREFAEPGAWRAAPGAHEALAALRAGGLATGVISNFDRRLHGILEGLHLAPLLDIVVLPSDARAAKPHPAIFAFALAKLGLAPSEALFVGDQRERDLEGARRAGLHAIDVHSLATLGELSRQLEMRTAASARERQ